jgi:hypothetical protein
METTKKNKVMPRTTEQSEKIKAAIEHLVSAQDHLVEARAALLHAHLPAEGNHPRLFLDRLPAMLIVIGEAAHECGHEVAAEERRQRNLANLAEPEVSH